MVKRIIIQYSFLVIILTGAISSLQAQHNTAFNPDFIKGLIDKNVRYFQDEVISNDPLNPRLITWNGATYYAGLLEAWKYTKDEEYLKQLKQVCQNFNWKLYPKYRNSTTNNLLIGDIYLQMYLREKDELFIKDLQKEINRIMSAGFTGGDYWWWVDALFMGPPTFALLSEVTNDPEYEILCMKNGN